MLDLKMIENLKKGDQLIVTTTGELWEVESVEIKRDRVNRIFALRVNISNERLETYFDEKRLHLFTLIRTLDSPTGKKTSKPKSTSTSPKKPTGKK